MKILEFDSSLYEKVGKCTEVQELKAVLAELILYYANWQKTLNDLLTNLDSDNVTGLDFSNTSVTNIDSVLKKYATKDWVNEN